MSKNSTTIKIDGSKLRQLLESKTGKTIYQIAVESGYTKNVLSNAVREGYASSAVQNIARLYGIAPDDYKYVEPEIPEFDADELKGQISIDDIESIKRDELKSIIKEAMSEFINNSEFRFVNDPITQSIKIYYRSKEA